ncbi:MAG: GntR family transcriptional regulator [Pseudomonadota bacterium]
MIVTKKQECQEDLIRRILTLDLEPGAVLDEAVLSESYGLSRTPLREVFQKLAGDGYISQTEIRRTKVSSMDIESMRNFFQVAPMVYSAVSRLAAESSTPRQIAHLRDHQVKFRRAAETANTSDMALTNHELHAAIGLMAGNVFLLPSLNRLLIDHTRMSQIFFRPRNSKERLTVWQACDQHDTLIDAFEVGDSEKAVQITLEHWDLSRDSIEKYSRPDPVPVEISLEYS